MKLLRQFSVYLLLIIVLSACGFHLRGLGNENKPLPFHTVFIESEGALQESLNIVFDRDSRIELSENVALADAVLKVDGEKVQKDILVINRGGNVNEYLLVLTTRAVLLKKGVQYPPLTITVRRTYSYSDNQILGKQNEEQVILTDMRNEAAEQILRRLSYLSPLPENSVSESSDE